MKSRYFVRFKYDYTRKELLTGIHVISETYKFIELEEGFDDKSLKKELERVTKLDLFDIHTFWYITDIITINKL